MHNLQSDNVVTVDFRAAAGMMPPQNAEVEEAILGGILLDPGAIARVADILRPEAFYVPQHRDIYKAALVLFSQGKPTDLMCVTTWLHDNDLLEQVGGQVKLAALVECTISAVNVDRYSAIVVDKYQRRRLIHAGNEIVKLGYETAVELEEVLNEAEQAVFDVGLKENNDVEPPIDIMVRVYETASAPRVKGLLSGIYDLDTLIGGFKRKKLYIVAGRSGMGKTQFACHLAAKAVKSGAPVIFFSAEMDRDELVTRLLAWESGVDAKKIEEGRLTQDDFSRLAESVNSFSNIPLYLDDTSGSALNPIRIRSGIRRATAMYGQPRLVVLDYLQLLGDESAKTNRVSELDKIANGCKAIAKEFDIPFVALAQINRATEGQANKRPVISQLRESGAIEQAADVILMLYREDYYNPNTPDKGICEIIVGKQRGGATGTVRVIFHPETSQFLSLAQSKNERAAGEPREPRDEDSWSDVF